MRWQRASLLCRGGARSGSDTGFSFQDQGFGIYAVVHLLPSCDVSLETHVSHKTVLARILPPFASSMPLVCLVSWWWSIQALSTQAHLCGTRAAHTELSLIDGIVVWCLVASV